MFLKSPSATECVLERTVACPCRSLSQTRPRERSIKVPRPLNSCFKKLERRLSRQVARPVNKVDVWLWSIHLRNEHVCVRCTLEPKERDCWKYLYDYLGEPDLFLSVSHNRCTLQIRPDYCAWSEIMFFWKDLNREFSRVRNRCPKLGAGSTTTVEGRLDWWGSFWSKSVKTYYI